MSRKNFRDPATLQRSPILTKFVSFPIRKGSNPDNSMWPSYGFGFGFLGGYSPTTLFMALSFVNYVGTNDILIDVQHVF
jgi:hypothetical protein